MLGGPSANLQRARLPLASVFVFELNRVSGVGGVLYNHVSQFAL